jgi:hypothetical protein
MEIDLVKNKLLPFSLKHVLADFNRNLKNNTVQKRKL